jgi:hypothetical protein
MTTESDSPGIRVGKFIFFEFVIVLVFAALGAFAQVSTTSLRGIVSDPAGGQINFTAPLMNATARSSAQRTIGSIRKRNLAAACPINPAS